MPPAVRSLAAPVLFVGRAPLGAPSRSGRPEPTIHRSDPSGGSPAGSSNGSSSRSSNGSSDRPDLSWRRAAACLGHDVSLFFPGGDLVPDAPVPDGAVVGELDDVDEQDEQDEQDEAIRVERAKAVCATCPVQTRCLQHALEHREHHGIWGGTTEAERRRIIRRRRRRTAGAG